jgi:hypothetical protein
MIGTLVEWRRYDAGGLKPVKTRRRPITRDKLRSRLQRGCSVVHACMNEFVNGNANP